MFYVYSWQLRLILGITFPGQVSTLRNGENSRSIGGTERRQNFACRSKSVRACCLGPMTAIFMSMHFTGVKGVGRPAECQPNTTGTVFKLVQSGKQAVRVQVGQTSAISVEIRTKAAKIIGRNRRPRTNHASPKHLHSSQISVRFGLSRSTPAPMRYSARSLTCVAMNHLFPNASLTPALRSP